MKSKNDLHVTLVQQNIIWENRAQNLSKLNHLLEGISKTDLIILPELFTTGFSMNINQLAESMSGESVEWMKNKAKQLQCYLLGSLIIYENQSYYNRLIVASPNEEVLCYDKRHLFSMGEEDTYYTKGNNKLLFEIKDWKILPLICYDLRFPVWSRNNDDYDLVIYTANWPAVRQNVWENLLVARAIENQAYCVGVNRVGRDGNNIKYIGGSNIIDAKGNSIYKAPENVECLDTVSLNLDKLNEFRQKFPVLKDRDQFVIDDLS